MTIIEHTLPLRVLVVAPEGASGAGFPDAGGPAPYRRAAASRPRSFGPTYGRLAICTTLMGLAA